MVESDIVDENKELFDECVRDLRRRILLPLSIEKNSRKIMGWVVYAIMARRGAKRKQQTIEKIQQEYTNR
ncbi:MAG: hypothetical protein KH921_09310 [Erysipelotrichaceae bacterium]|nr:hypothetical protein [Erysipelotrichaceae bacterium]